MLNVCVCFSVCVYIIIGRVERHTLQSPPDSHQKFPADALQVSSSPDSCFICSYHDPQYKHQSYDPNQQYHRSDPFLTPQVPRFLLQIRTNNRHYRRQQIAITFMSIFKQLSPPPPTRKHFPPRRFPTHQLRLPISYYSR